MYDTHFVSAVIVAAGAGRRMGAGGNKLLLEISGKSILSYTLEAFNRNKYVDEIIVVINPAEKEKIAGIAKASVTSKKFKLINGGKTRQESAYNGLKAINGGIVLIHDGARALVPDKIITEAIDAAAKHGCAAPGIPVTNTIKVTECGFAEKTLNRDSLISIQTPQAFMHSIILSAHKIAENENFSATDDCMLLERLGHKVKITEGSKNNIKITTKEDLAIARFIISERNSEI